MFRTNRLWRKLFLKFNTTVCTKHISVQPEFTKISSNVSRGNYNFIQPKHVNYFENLLGANKIVTDLSDLEKYNVDHLKHFRGDSRLVLKPSTTEEVSKILSFCNDELLAVCPQGGNTGLCGGATPVFDEVVISTELMNKIIDFDETSGILICQSGSVLQNLEHFVRSHNAIMPVDLASTGSCQIGGNLSTNAGGLRLMRYGNLHGNVLGVEVVQANGNVLDCSSTCKKDNTGYHLKHLFIGSEGTLGLITKVSIQCPPKPKSINLAFLGHRSFSTVLQTLTKAREDLGEILSAVEVMDATYMEMMGDNINVRPPIGNYPFYLMIETSGSNEAHDQEKLDKFLEDVMEKNLVLNGTVLTEPSKQKEAWEVRDRVTEASLKESYVFYFDISLSVDQYYELVDEVRMYLKDKALRVFGFGHLGDSNLHLDVSVKEYSPDLHSDIEEFIYKRVMKLGGSFSAEHGVGIAKSKYLKLSKDTATMNLMKDLKNLMDPNNILNPYKIFV